MKINEHKPVLLEEAISSLNIRKNLHYVDATFGFGGYTKKILDKTECQVIAIDRDPEVERHTQKFNKNYKKRFKFFLGKFSNLKNILAKEGLEFISGGIVADLGMSSMQIENQQRGFSFMKEGPLDMRMSKNGTTAEEVINTLDEQELANIFWKYGEEKNSRKIAKTIVKERKSRAISTTFELVKIIQKVVPKRNNRIHPATKVFQSLRIFINNEIEELNDLLASAENLLLPGSRLAIVSFHSLEDRLIKLKFNKLVGYIPNANRHLPTNISKKKPHFKKVFKNIITPKDNEIDINRRARSAKLRVIEKIQKGEMQ